MSIKEKVNAFLRKPEPETRKKAIEAIASWDRALKQAIEVAEERERNEMKSGNLYNWTLKEVKEYCNSRIECTGCDFYNKDVGCRIMKALEPGEWDFPTSSKFTTQEVEDAKMLMRAFPQYDTIIRKSRSYIRLTAELMTGVILNGKMFPSLGVGDSVKVAEIARSEQP
jgi:hypothetical protein